MKFRLCIWLVLAVTNFGLYVMFASVPTVRFTENKGQWPAGILYRAQVDGGAVFIENNSWTYHFYDAKTYRQWHHAGITKRPKNISLQHYAYKTEFLNASSLNSWNTYLQSSDYVNYYLGNNPQQWVNNIHHYERIVNPNLYPGIAVELTGLTQGIKYTFTVNPGHSPSVIKMQYTGVDHIRIDKGRLIIQTNLGDIIEQKPYAYQLINGIVKTVTCNYTLKKHCLSFDFPNGYNPSCPLIIDPVLVFAAQSGSTADNFGMTATYDAAGNLYAGGTAYSVGYPTTLGAFQTAFNGPQNGTDVVITKYNANGNALLYSTYLGGSNYEVVSSMIVDNNNNLCLYGATGSSNFPVLANAFDNSFNGGPALSFVMNGTSYSSGTDIFVSKFNSTGSQLLGSTYIGGSQNDGVNHVNHLTFIANTYWEYYIDSLQYNYGDQYRGEIQVDRYNNIFVCSSTRSSDFPTLNAFDNTLGGKQDAIVFKFNPSLNQLLFSTFIGGSQNDCGNSILIKESDGSVYFTGGTCSSDFPVTSAAYSNQYLGGKSDAFLVHLNASGNQIIASTYFGTSDYDQSYFVQSDSKNRIYVFGQSMGSFPVLNTSTITPLHNPGRHQFIARFNAALSQLNKATVFGNYTTQVDIAPSAFAVDRCSNIYLSGWGGNIITNGPPLQNMPLMAATQSTTDGFDFYILGMDSSWVLQYGTYFGGGLSQEHVDGGTSRFDARGKIYQSACAGCGGHDDFPVTPGAWPNSPGNPNHSGNCNNGVLKIDFQLPLAISTINTNTLSGCSPFTATLSNATPPLGANATFTWYLANAQTNTTLLNPNLTFTAAGQYTVALVVKDPAACNIKDSSALVFNVWPSPIVQFTTQHSNCSSTVAVLVNTLTGQTYNLNWGNGLQTNTVTTQQLNTYSVSGIYSVNLTGTNVYGCSATQFQTVAIIQFSPTLPTGGSVCAGQQLTLEASGGNTYLWQPSLGLSNYTNGTTVFNGSVNTQYTLTVQQQTLGQTCQTSQTLVVDVKPSPIAQFNYSVSSCGGGVNFFNASSADVQKWYWQFNATQTSTVQNPYFFFSGGGVKLVKLIVTNAFGCSSAFQTTLNAGVAPQLAINSGSYICSGDSALLFASGGQSYTWQPLEDFKNPFLASGFVKPLTSTSYTVIIKANTLSSACLYTLTTQVTVDYISQVKPITAVSNPVKIRQGETSTLSYLGDPGAFIYWMPATQPVSGYTVNASPQITQIYTVQISKGQCIETRTVLVEVYSDACNPDVIFIPNTFTPNRDGINDVLLVRSNALQSIYFAVYNRWGERVFETRNLNSGWDGTINTSNAEQGVYGWYIEAECFNGRKTFKKGNVTLLR